MFRNRRVEKTPKLQGLDSGSGHAERMAQSRRDKGSPSEKTKDEGDE